MKQNILSAIEKGFLSAGMLLILYFLVISFVSGWSFAQSQFRQFWYYIMTLAIGFGLQVGLYSYVKRLAKQDVSSNVVVATGATSTGAMISCCAHYLVNIVPAVGAVGILTLISQYQVQLFLVGITVNFFGIVSLLSRLAQYGRYEVK